MEIDVIKYKVPSGGLPGQRSEFWRELSWRCGDEHANRICKWIDFYCWLFRLSRERFYRTLPRA